MMPMEGMSTQRGLALELGREQLLPLLDLAADQIGPDAERVGIVDLRHQRGVVGRSLGDGGGIGGRRILHFVRQRALAGDVAAVRIFALGEQRYDLVPVLDLGDLDALHDAARKHLLHGPVFEVGDVDGGRLGDDAVDQRVAVDALHLDGEAQVLARLAGDVDDGGIGRPDMVEGDVLEVLRPERRKAGDRTRPDRRAGDRRTALQNGPPGHLVLSDRALVIVSHSSLPDEQRVHASPPVVPVMREDTTTPAD